MIVHLVVSLFFPEPYKLDFSFYQLLLKKKNT
jgi:hypothetical protein